MKILGIIPARGGSKGLPGKNIKVLGAKPLIEYTLDSVKASKLLSRTIVSTDSEEIAECAQLLGADVPFLRPSSLAVDMTPTIDVVKHALTYLTDTGEQYDAVCILQVTSPFRPFGFIDKAIAKFRQIKSDSLVSVLSVPDKFNPSWVFKPNAEGFLSVSTNEKSIISRRQDLPAAYFRDGSIYISTTDIILNGNSLYGNRINYLQNDPRWYVNIDTQEDWALAELILSDYLLACSSGDYK